MEANLKENLTAATESGKRDDYAMLTRKYSRQVFAVCLGITGNIHDAEDIAQEAMLKGLRGKDKLRDNESFGGWICQIARNLCFDYFRTQKRKRDYLEKQKHRCEITAKAHSEPDHSDLQKAISRLEEKNRLALMSYYFDGQDTKNVSQALGITPAAVATRLSRARRQLRQLLEEQEVSNG
jgi:RNA polymerase sigma factor (sigma-70 family)